ncbi:MAG TPA: WYL domain-containing protein [Polyangia bacterium]|jgi:proteasome accessory factor C
MSAVEERLRRMLFMVPYVAKQKAGVPKEELAKKLGIDVPTLERDVDLVGLVGAEFDGTQGIDITIDDEDGRVYVHHSQGLTRPPRLTVPEAYALLAGAQVLRGSGIHPYDEAIARAEEKLRSALAGGVRELAQRESQIVIAADDPAGLRLVPVLYAASDRRATVEVDYYSAGRGAIERRRIDPYGLVDHRGFWYLVGHCHKHAEIRLFRCERMANCTDTGETFELPADFDIERYRRDSMLIAAPEKYHVVVRLRGGAAQRLAAWDTARPLEGGGLEVTFDNPGLEWLCGWVLRLGSEAEVIEPPVLREAVKERAGRIARAHAA